MSMLGKKKMINWDRISVLVLCVKVEIALKVKGKKAGMQPNHSVESRLQS